ncbi:MAG: MFS transporter [Anaerolineae bacterium]|nr:MFS transporter [Anaerolineae bacterium]MCO5192653.1 MFS transporter [Anaerolineae bacterium]
MSNNIGRITPVETTVAVPPQPLSAGKLSTSTKFFYGIGDWGTAAATLARQLFWFVFLTEVVGLPAGVAGIVSLFGRIWDAINDPLIGTISDHISSCWGRRRPFFLIGAIPFGFSFFLMFAVPVLPNLVWYTIYYIIVFLIFDTSYTLINVPYTALTAELTEDYDERSSLTGWRMSVAILANLITAGLFKLLAENVFANWFGDAPHALQYGYMVSAALWGLSMTLSTLIVFTFIREPVRTEAQTPPIRPIQTFKEVFSNRPFRLAATIYLLTLVSVDIVATVMVPFLLFYLGFDRGWDSAMLAVVMLVGFLTMPLTVKITRTFGKINTYIATMFLWGIVMLLMGQAPPGIAPQILIFFGMIAGLGFGAANIIPWALIADVVEVDEWRTGQRREGIYAGYLVFFRKLTSSGAVFAVGLILSFLGYDEVEKSAESITALRIMISVVPAILLIMAILVARRYPLNKQAHDELRRKLAVRRALQQNQSIEDVESST